MENAREILASNLNYLIKNRGITPKELAERTKVTKMSVSNWIQGKNSPDSVTFLSHSKKAGAYRPGFPFIFHHKP